MWDVVEKGTSVDGLSGITGVQAQWAPCSQHCWKPSLRRGLRHDLGEDVWVALVRNSKWCWHVCSGGVGVAVIRCWPVGCRVAVGIVYWVVCLFLVRIRQFWLVSLLAEAGMWDAQWAQWLPCFLLLSALLSETTFQTKTIPFGGKSLFFFSLK